MLRTMARVFGWVLLVIGVLGFLPAVTPDGHLLGVFEVGPIHNVIHLVTGAAALWAGYTSTKASRMYFQVFGVVYALITVLGFLAGDNELLGFVEHNNADIYLHLVIALVALYLGFVAKDESA